MKKKEVKEVIVDGLYRAIRKIIEQGRKTVSITANAVLVRQNWMIGKLIVEDEQHGKRKADYGKRTLELLSFRLSADYGRGYDASNLRYMRQFYLAFPICDALRHELSWTHYRILMRENDPIAREWYMNESVADGWSSRDLDRQVSTDAYHRRLAVVNPDHRRKRRELPLSPLPEKMQSLVPKELYQLQMQEMSMGEESLANSPNREPHEAVTKRGTVDARSVQKRKGKRQDYCGGSRQ